MIKCHCRIRDFSAPFPCVQEEYFGGGGGSGSGGGGGEKESQECTNWIGSLFFRANKSRKVEILLLLWGGGSCRRAQIESQCCRLLSTENSQILGRFLDKRKLLEKIPQRVRIFLKRAD